MLISDLTVLLSGMGLTCDYGCPPPCLNTVIQVGVNLGGTWIDGWDYALWGNGVGTYPATTGKKDLVLRLTHKKQQVPHHVTFTKAI